MTQRRDLARTSPFAPLVTIALSLALGACAAKPPPEPPKTPADDTKESAAAAAPSDKHAVAEAAPHVDPNEKDGPIVLDSLVAKGAPKGSFPKGTVGDHECLKQIPFSGKHKADYATIVGLCGTPTGMLQYTTPAEGRLHAKLDKRDHFQLKVYKDMCYRYFAVADDGIKDIDIVVMKKGALVAMDKTEQPIAVIESEKLWCVDDDMDLDFAVEVDGPGAGGYTFGVWTRPK